MQIYLKENLDKVIFKLTKMYLLVIFYKLPYSVFLYLISVLSVFSSNCKVFYGFRGVLSNDLHGVFRARNQRVGGKDK